MSFWVEMGIVSSDLFLETRVQWVICNWTRDHRDNHPQTKPLQVEPRLQIKIPTFITSKPKDGNWSGNTDRQVSSSHWPSKSIPLYDGDAHPMSMKLVLSLQGPVQSHPRLPKRLKWWSPPMMKMTSCRRLQHYKRAIFFLLHQGQVKYERGGIIKPPIMALTIKGRYLQSKNLGVNQSSLMGEHLLVSILGRNCKILGVNQSGLMGKYLLGSILGNNITI